MSSDTLIACEFTKAVKITPCNNHNKENCIQSQEKRFNIIL